MKYSVPGVGEITLDTIILDLNGTLSVGGTIVDGVKQRIDALKKNGFTLVLFTGNTRGDADDIANELGIEWVQAHTAEDKRDLALQRDPERCVSIGNGRIDKELMEVVSLAIVTLQAEGIHIETFQASDIVVPTINDALDLLIDNQRLIATLRK